jgi:hypothetical protein
MNSQSRAKGMSLEKRLHLLESFTATGSDGGTYKIRGYEHLVRDESVAGVERWEPTGEIEYRLASGELVDARRDGSMRIAHSGVELTPCREGEPH